MSETTEKKTVQGEGKDLISAISSAAEALGVSPDQVGYKLDLSHFRSATGGMLPKNTVRIIGWVQEGGNEVAAVAARAPRREQDDDRPPRRERDEDRPRRDRDEDRPRRERKPRREREPRTEAREEPERREEEPPALPDDELQAAVAYCGTWFEGLLQHMDVEGSVTASARGGRVHLDIRAERAGRIIGKRGSTLRAIRHLLRLAVTKHHGDVVVDVDVEDPRREAEGGERRERRPERGGRDRDRDRDRGRGRRGGDRGDRGDRGRKPGKTEYPEEKLQALARRAAEKAVETGKTITINLELSSYERRIMHLEISEIDGVSSQSEERDGVKFIQVIPG